MRSVGSILLLLGVISAVLKLFFVGYYHMLLTWVDNWGNGVGWAIRIGLIVLGAALMLADKMRPGSQKP